MSFSSRVVLVNDAPAVRNRRSFELTGGAKLFNFRRAEFDAKHPDSPGLRSNEVFDASQDLHSLLLIQPKKPQFLIDAKILSSDFLECFCYSPPVLAVVVIIPACLKFLQLGIVTTQSIH